MGTMDAREHTQQCRACGKAAEGGRTFAVPLARSFSQHRSTLVRLLDAADVGDEQHSIQGLDPLTPFRSDRSSCGRPLGSLTLLLLFALLHAPFIGILWSSTAAAISLTISLPLFLLDPGLQYRYKPLLTVTYCTHTDMRNGPN